MKLFLFSERDHSHRTYRMPCKGTSLFFQPCRSSPVQLLFSRDVGHAAAAVDALRRPERSQSASAHHENRLLFEGAPSSGHPRRAALRATDQANAPQNAIRHYVQLHFIRGRCLLLIESVAREILGLDSVIFTTERKCENVKIIYTFVQTTKNIKLF